MQRRHCRVGFVKYIHSPIGLRKESPCDHSYLVRRNAWENTSRQMTYLGPAGHCRYTACDKKTGVENKAFLKCRADKKIFVEDRLLWRNPLNV